MKRSAASAFEPSRSKKARVTGHDEAAKARYVEPLSEAGANEDTPEAGSSSRAEPRISSWADVEIPEAESSEGEDEDVEGDFESWTKALQELCRKLRPELGRGQRSDKVSAEEILQRIRAALKGGDWQNLTAALWVPRSGDVVTAVKQLSSSELLAFTKALCERYEYPRERVNCERWFSQIFEHGPHTVIESDAFRDEVRPLIKILTEALKPADFGGQVLHCLGKWRMLQKLSQDYHAHHPAQDDDEEDQDEEDEDGDKAEGDEDEDDEDDEG